jgi:hypothetical protein
MTLPLEIWSMILDKISFDDCLQFRKTCKNNFYSINHYQPFRFASFDTIIEFNHAMKQGLLFWKLIDHHSHYSPMFLRARQLDCSLITVGGNKLILIQLLYIPMSWMTDKQLYFQMSIQSLILQNYPITTAVQQIHMNGLDSYSVSLLHNHGYDHLCCGELLSKNSVKEIEDLLRKGYRLKRMVDATIGYCVEMSSDQTLNEHDDECYFEIPHWQSYSSTAESVVELRGQEVGKAFPITKPEAIHRFLRMISRRWIRYYE